LRVTDPLMRRNTEKRELTSCDSRISVNERLLTIDFFSAAESNERLIFRIVSFKGVIQSKKTFDMCYQTLRGPHRYQQN